MLHQRNGYRANTLPSNDHEQWTNGQHKKQYSPMFLNKNLSTSSTVCALSSTQKYVKHPDPLSFSIFWFTKRKLATSKKPSPKISVTHQWNYTFRWDKVNDIPSMWLCKTCNTTYFVLEHPVHEQASDGRQVSLSYQRSVIPCTYYYLVEMRWRWGETPD